MLKRLRNVFVSEAGFTLIELLVVIAVLGILAGIAVPRLTGVKDKARNAAITTQADAVSTGMQLFFAENGRYPTNSDLTDASIDSWDNLDQVLDTVELTAVGTKNGQIPLDEEGNDGNDNTAFSYEVDNDNEQFLITLPSSLNETIIYVGEKSVSSEKSEASDYTSGS